MRLGSDATRGVADDGPAFSEDDFFAWRTRFERMSEAELAGFREHPDNRALLRQYDCFALRQVLPYAIPLAALSVLSFVAGWALNG